MRAFSTGPLENNVPNDSETVIVKVLNNDRNDSARAEIRVFALNGEKTLIGSKRLYIKSRASDYAIFKTEQTVEFEVQVQVDDDDVMPAVFGLRKNGQLNPNHRILTSELTHVDKLDDEK